MSSPVFEWTTSDQEEERFRALLHREEKTGIEQMPLDESLFCLCRRALVDFFPNFLKKYGLFSRRYGPENTAGLILSVGRCSSTRCIG